jgi:hypothetical protein
VDGAFAGTTGAPASSLGFAIDGEPEDEPQATSAERSAEAVRALADDVNADGVKRRSRIALSLLGTKRA